MPRAWMRLQRLLHQFEFGKIWYGLKQSKKEKTVLKFFVAPSIFSTNEHQHVATAKCYLKCADKWEETLSNEPSSSLCFLSARCFFSQIFFLHAANEKSWRDSKEFAPRASTFVWAVLKMFPLLCKHSPQALPHYLVFFKRLFKTLFCASHKVSNNT